MNVSINGLLSSMQYSCRQCPLRERDVFRDLAQEELEFVQEFKKGELSVEKGATLLAEGNHNPHFYTVLTGWAFRYKLLDDGRRQIVNFVMPGDLVGLQGSLMGEMQHSVEALSPMLQCMFERNRQFSLYSRFPSLAYDLTWIASREEVMLDENLLSVGRRTALERVAYLLALILSRSAESGLISPHVKVIPITQQHLADTLGLSLVHTNKTLRKLVQKGLIAWGDGGCRIFDVEGLFTIAGWDGDREQVRPFL
jgi:CRP-like cAMP-binding protein